MTRIILNGCNGKMGKVISQSIMDNYDDCEVVCGVDINTTKQFDYNVVSSPDEINVEADVIIDFSLPVAFDNIMKYAQRTKTPIVVATTGLSDEQIYVIKSASEIIPVFFTANMSLGVNLISELAQKAAEVLGRKFDVEIVELHHNQKVDSPSGTALLLADTIRDSLKDETKYVYGREGHAKREQNEIGIHAIRGGGIVGDHDVIFAGTGEVIELTHKAISREVFAVGALKACEFMGSITSPGLYDMNDVIGLND